MYDSFDDYLDTLEHNSGNKPIEYCYNCGRTIDDFNHRKENNCMGCENED